MSHGPSPHSTRAPQALPSQDLSNEGLLHKAARDGQGRPLMSGIPLIAKIGQGGMGAVYYGIHPRLNLEVAVKVLPFHLADRDPDMIRRFFGEAQIAARVQSDHIVRVLDVNEEAGVYFLVMEFVRGLSAAGVLKKLQKGEAVSGVAAAPTAAGAAALPLAAALAIVTAAARGLKAAHQQDVIHRDIKPDNILIPREHHRSTAAAAAVAPADAPLDLTRAKLADLGLAKQDDGQSMGTLSQMAMGTPGYMAPEQVRDAKRATKRSDVFSLGATLYALLAGRLPFAGTGVGDILIKTVSSPHEPLGNLRPDLPAPVIDLIDWCLDKEAEKRPTDGADLLNALEACAAACGSAASAPTVGAAAPLIPSAAAAGLAARTPPGSFTPPPVSAAPNAVTAPALAPSPAATPGSTPAAAPGWAADGRRPGPLGPTSPATAPTPPRRRAPVGLILLVSLLVLAAAGGGLWWWIAADRAERGYQWLLHDGQATLTQAQADYAAGNITAEQYETQLLNAQNEFSAALERFPGRSEAEIAKRDATARLNELRNARADQAVAAKTKFQALLQQAQQAEISADREPDPARALTAWQNVQTLYRQAQALVPDDGICREALTRAGDRVKGLQSKQDAATQSVLGAAGLAFSVGLVEPDPAEKKKRFIVALQHYTEALALAPNDPEIQLKRARMQSKLMELDSYLEEIAGAEEELNRVDRAVDPAGMETAAKLAAKHLAAARQIEIGTAPPDTARLVRAVGEKQNCLAKCADARRLQAAGQLAEAAALFKAALGFAPDAAYPSFMAGQIQSLALQKAHIGADGYVEIELEAAKAVAVYFDRATRIAPDFTAAWIAWGDLLSITGVPADYPEDEEVPSYQAIAKYELATRADPRSVEAWRKLAAGHARWAGNVPAILAYRHAIELAPTDGDLQREMGQCYVDTGCPALALPCFESALRLAPADFGALAARARALVELNRHAEAAQAAQAALDLEPGDEEMKNLRTEQLTLALQRSTTRTQIKTGRQALAGGDNREDNYLLVGEALYALNCPRESRLLLAQAVIDYPSNPALWGALATALAACGQYDGAITAADKAIVLGADRAVWDPRLTAFRQQQKDQTERRRNIADNEAKLREHPDDTDIFYNLCWQYYEDGNYDEARHTAGLGTAQFPADADLWSLYFDSDEQLVREAYWRDQIPAE